VSARTQGTRVGTHQRREIRVAGSMFLSEEREGKKKVFAFALSLLTFSASPAGKPFAMVTGHHLGWLTPAVFVLLPCYARSFFSRCFVLRRAVESEAAATQGHYAGQSGGAGSSGPKRKRGYLSARSQAAGDMPQGFLGLLRHRQLC
jgi:hypothetical protein